MNELVVLFLFLGVMSFSTGTIGIIRFPDFYTRLHAAGKCDTMAVIFCLLSIALYNLSIDMTWSGALVSFKILLILVFVFVASPTSTHAISQAALIIGVEPWGKEKK